MKQSFFQTTLLIAAVFLFSCQLVAKPLPQGRKTLNLDKFTGVSLARPFTVHIKQGSPQSVEIEASQKVIDDLDLSVKNGVWTIRSKSKSKTDHSEDESVHVYITLPSVSSLEVTGSGRIETTNALSAGNMKLRLTGSGELNAQVKVQNLDVLLTGSGDMKLSGSADNFNQAIAGSGDSAAQGLSAKNVTVKVTGSGRAEVSASANLDALVTGSGDIVYHGNPTVNQKVAGSGEIRKAQ